MSVSGLVPPPLSDLGAHGVVALQHCVFVALHVQGSLNPHDFDPIAPPQILEVAVLGACEAIHESMRHNKAAVSVGNSGGRGRDCHRCRGLAVMGGVLVCGHCTVLSDFSLLGRRLVCCFISFIRGFPQLLGHLVYSIITRGFPQLGGHLVYSIITRGFPQLLGHLVYSIITRGFPQLGGRLVCSIITRGFPQLGGRLVCSIITRGFPQLGGHLVYSIITRGFPQLGGHLVYSLIVNIFNGEYLFEISLPFFVVVFIVVLHFVNFIFIFSGEYLLEISLPFLVFVFQFVDIIILFISIINISLNLRVCAPWLSFKKPFRSKVRDWLIGLQEGDFFFVYVQEERVEAATSRQLAEKLSQVSAARRMLFLKSLLNIWNVYVR
ncbi:uncharacterized protein LOC127003829 isoform X1 [Eriocheir sinensis]|uniref:uncharacterized protein LOC127003829 isoform X1 n=1 Tax=Eriocheir sinensis TaxID=95602 RepID=UPI0021C8D565|nr:uncharacterized protein LOC127003829 isoform X1 [Eriocheir sinensis]